MLTLLLLLACTNKDLPEQDSLSDDSATDDSAPGDSVPEDWGSPELFGDTSPRLGALQLTLDEADGGATTARALVSAASDVGVPLDCGSYTVDAELLWSPDADISERWSAASEQRSLSCGEAPPQVVWVVSPRLLQGELRDATVRAVTQGSEAVEAAGGQSALVLMSETPALLCPLGDAPGELSYALSELPEDLSSARGDVAATLALAQAELGGAPAHLALLLEDADVLAFKDLDSLGLQQPFPLTHVLTMSAPGLAEDLSASTGGWVLEAPTRAALSAGALAVAGFAEEALSVEVVSPTRPRQCPQLHGLLSATLDGAALELPWRHDAPCPDGLPEQFQDRFLIDPIDDGADDNHLSTPALRYGFGPRRLNSGAYDLHRGVDYEVDTGAQLVAVAPGEVVHAGWDRENYSDSGIFIVIDHGGGFASWYIHLDSTQVSQGDLVERGDPIGISGSTETTVAHLHLALTACVDCEPGVRPNYTDEVRNPMWLLPRADGLHHEVSALDIRSGVLSFEVSVPADEADLQEVIVRTSGGERSLHVDQRENLDPDDEVVNGISALPSAGPNNAPFVWEVSFEDVASSGLQEVEVIDLAGHSVVVTPE